jgi:aminoglycoside phosphotransferase (APT) family kinase protein
VVHAVRPVAVRRSIVPAVGAQNMPAADVEISLDLVRLLLAEQHPDLAGRPLAVLASGWDNLIVQLGDSLLLRLPRRAAAAELVRHEQRWLPELAPRLPLPIPAPIRFGRPGLGYPWAWSVVPLLPGHIAAHMPPTDLGAAADLLGRFLGTLHAPAAGDHPRNPVRGVPLAARDAVTVARIAELDGAIDGVAARRCWREALTVPPWTGLPVWLHGDLHPANVLVDSGTLSAIIDFGDITAGDPATDLAVAWMLLPNTEHAALRSGYQSTNETPIDDATWARARGWTLTLSVAFLAHSADNPLMADIGQRTIQALLA